MKYYPEQTQDNINLILKQQNKTFDEMALDFKNDPIELQQEIFSGRISLDKLGSIAEYLNTPIDSLLSDALEMNIDFDQKHQKREEQSRLEIISALVLSHRSAQFTNAVDSSVIEEVCNNAVIWAEGLVKALKKK